MKNRAGIYNIYRTRYFVDSDFNHINGEYELEPSTTDGTTVIDVLTEAKRQYSYVMAQKKFLQDKAKESGVVKDASGIL